MNRVRAGFCEVPNPFNAKQISRVSLHPEDVDALVFWTRDPSAMVRHVLELEERGLPCSFLVTILGYPEVYEPKAPDRKRVIEAFREVGRLVGSERLAWRYDPIILSDVTDPGFHRQIFSDIAEGLEGATSRCILSVLDLYPGVMRAFRGIDASFIPWKGDWLATGLAELAPFLVRCGREHGMTIQSCAEAIDLSPWGILPGACVDAEWISVALGRTVKVEKDPNQRERCLCARAKDIGVYDTCVFGCRYCYATKSVERAKKRFKEHDPSAVML